MNIVGKYSITALCMALCIFMMFTWPITQSIMHVWMYDTTFYHCFLVLPIFFVGLYLKREMFDIYPIRFEALTVPIFAITSVLMVISYWGGFNIIAHFLWVFNVILIAIAALGRHILRYNFALFGFLFFMVPFGTEFIIPLQNLTAFVSVSLLKLSGIDVVYEGIHIITPHVRFYVAEACAGLRFLVANVFICYIFAYLYFHQKRSWILFGAISVFIPVIGNCLRGYLIMLIGHLSSGALAAGVDHIIYGWGFFSLLAFINLIIGEKIAKKETILETPTAPKLPFGTYDKTRDKFYPYNHFYQKRIFLSFVIIILTPFTLNHYFEKITYKKQLTKHLILRPDITEIVPFNFADASKIKVPLIKDFNHADHQKALVIDQKIKVQASYYDYQDANKEVSTAFNRVHNETDRFLLAQHSTRIQNIPYNVIINGHIGRRRYITLMTYFYKDVQNNSIKYTNSRWKIQYYSMLNLLYHGDNSAGILLIERPLRQKENAKDALKTFKDILKHQ